MQILLQSKAHPLYCEECDALRADGGVDDPILGGGHEAIAPAAASSTPAEEVKA